jgi:hypothetical protein
MGTITFTVGGGVPETHVVSPSDASVTPLSRSGTCAVAGPTTVVSPSDAINPGEIWVECEPAVGSLLLSAAIPDVRDLGVGTYASLVGPPMLLFQKTAPCTGPANSGANTIEITRAEGGAAAYPAAVSGDYVREFSIHMQAEQSAATGGNGCANPAVTVTADLRFVVEAASAVNDPNGLCGCV